MMEWLGLDCVSLHPFQWAGLPKLGKSYSRMRCPRAGRTPPCPQGDGGEPVPGHTDTVTELRKGPISPWVQTILLQVAKHHLGSKEDSPHSSHGVGGCAGLRSSGAGVGKGAEEGIEVLKCSRNAKANFSSVT